MTDAKEGTVCKKRKKRSYRLKAKNIAITWSDAATIKPTKEFLQKIAEQYLAERYVICAEKHESGTWHVHAYFGYDDDFETENCRFFDTVIESGIIHPNVVACKKGKQQGWINYCMKDGYYVAQGCIFKEIETFKGFRNRLGDKRAYEEHKLRESMQEISWPMNILGVAIPKPNPANKLRHWIFVGPPDLGKTRTLQIACRGKKTFWPGRDALYRWENYEKEELIILDDFMIPDQELIEVTETWEIIRKCSGGSRYMTHNWPIDVTRTIIMITNNYPELSSPMKARFNICELDVPLESSG